MTKLVRHLTSAILLLTALQSAKVFAADMIDLPEEELARESVTPIFDKNPSTKGRLIVLDKKVDLNLFYGTALTEPIANVSRFGLSAYYHSSEKDAWGALLMKNSTGLSSYASQLKTAYDLNFSRAPAPDTAMMLDYNHMAFYGKMSITKRTVINTHLFGSVAAGLIKFVHKSYPGVAFGVGQKFYLSKSLSFRFDFRVFLNNAPVPFLKSRLKSTDPIPSFDEFSERLTTTSALDLGLSYLF